LTGRRHDRFRITQEQKANASLIEVFCL
jgi:hypothetical protein